MNASINTLDLEEATAALQACCGATRWVSAMVAARPFAGRDELRAKASSIWDTMERGDILEAFEHHPRIGADLEGLRKKFAATLGLSSFEQAGVNTASEKTLVALRDGNQAYEERFGHIFIVCATGKTATEMLAILEQRMTNDPTAELRKAALEQGKIIQLRLEGIPL